MCNPDATGNFAKMPYCFWIIIIQLILPICGQAFDRNLQHWRAHFNPDLKQQYKTTEKLLQQIHDHSAYKTIFMNVTNNSSLQPLIDCFKNESQCLFDDIFPLLATVQKSLSYFLIHKMQMDAQCGEDLAYHWASVINLTFVGVFEVSCLTSQTQPVCNPNGTAADAINALLKESEWAFIRM